MPYLYVKQIRRIIRKADDYVDEVSDPIKGRVRAVTSIVQSVSNEYIGAVRDSLAERPEVAGF